MRTITLKTGIKCGLLSIFMMLALAGVARGYTLVMLDGRHIEIGNSFAVSPTALTYEVSPGMQVTVLMASIDITSTERANNEAPGSLLGRMSQRSALVQTTENPSNHVAIKATRSVSNQDLERFAQVRRNSEQAYEERLKNLGLPSMAVLRAQNAADSERFWKELEQKRAEAEAIERTAELQTQIAELSANLNYLKERTENLQERPVEQAPFTSDVFTGYNSNPFFGSYDPYYGSYDPFYRSYTRSRVNPALWRTPFGLPIGGAFGSFNVPVDNQSRFYGRRNVFTPRGTQLRGGNRIGSRSHWHGRRR